MGGENYEIERKFLIRYPSRELLEKCGDITDIEQTYLVRTEQGRSARVRKRGRDGRYVYTYTEKERISDLRRIEDEREVSAEEYRELLKRADSSREVIRKKRCCLEYMGRIFEIDILPFWDDRAVMEIELDSEEDAVAFPEDIEIIREISSDRRYTNSAMAKRIPDDAPEAGDGRAARR